MRLGEAAAPPSAFLAFCERSPTACGDAPPEVVRTVARAELAQRSAAEAQLASGRRRTNPVATAAMLAQPVNWSEAFAEARRRREALTAPTVEEKPDWAAVFAAARAAREAAAREAEADVTAEATVEARGRLLRSAAGETKAAPITLAWSGKVELKAAAETSSKSGGGLDRSPSLAMTTALWSTLNKVNDKVNRAIARKTDIANYGQIDFWTLPLAEGQAAGDCEDYVLEKKRALIKAGLPASALSIAVVTTSWGEAHAVLVVETDKGDYVLDNTTPWILPWRKANLTWHERQVAGSAFRWANVASPRPYQIAKTSLSLSQP